MKAVLAQLVERVAFNHVVVGSIPTDGGNICFTPIISINHLLLSKSCYSWRCSHGGGGFR